ncbi:MAG TPA: molybdopterin-dependent oxidoreductase, partial [Casimicrobiaceae bacterium]|nr:molybdopterin-dependent oxidoreductase [Casimicrobiaceae bacterium]
MNAPAEVALAAELIEFRLNGEAVSARPGETLIEAAKRHGVEIPHLCYKPGMRPDGNCRACMVEIKGERVLAPSCCRTPTAGMEVSSDSPRAVHSQKIVVEMLAADVPARVYKLDSELEQWKRWLGIGAPRFAARAQPQADLSHPAIAVNLDACIQCTRCVRACREEQVNDVIGYAFRGAHSAIVFDLGDPMGVSTCVACGECVQACPTGALAPANDAYLVVADKVVPSVCPYCGVGCQLDYHVKDNEIVRVEGRDGPANHQRLCVKGRYGYDYVHHPQRLTRPLIRKQGVAKSADFVMDPADPLAVFREASWEEALQVAGGALKRIRDEHGGKALAGFGSAKGSNEEAYLFQKLVRTGFGSNNVDHCTRLCHASSVAALLEGIGSGAVSNPVMDVMKAEVVLLIGANPVVNHPVAATWIKNAVRNGTKLILADPRRSELARHATHYLQFKPDTDVALLNAMMHVIVEEGLVAQSFVADRTSGFEEIRKNVAGYSPEAMAPVCGIPAATIREVARLYATSRGSMILWGMGISQHVHGTDNARCLIALSMMTGQVGRPGTGLHPLRGQNNVQGASDVGLIPMMYPDYQRVDNAGTRSMFEEIWGTALDPQPGLTVVEIMNAVHAG